MKNIVLFAMLMLYLTYCLNLALLFLTGLVFQEARSSKSFNRSHNAVVQDYGQDN